MLRSDDCHRTPAMVFHNNGGLSIPGANHGTLAFKHIRNRFFRDRSVKGSGSRPENLEIVLCHNYRDPPLAQRSLDHLGVHDYVRLGADIVEWNNIERLTLLADHLEFQSTCEYVLHVDANDVLIVASPDRVLARFLDEFDCDILFNSEKISWPGSHAYPGVPAPPALVDLAPELRQRFMRGYERASVDETEASRLRDLEAFERSHAEQPFVHLNAGACIGRRVALVELLRAAHTRRGAFPSWPRSDQGLIREEYRLRYPRVRIDDGCRIFQCMKWTARGEIASPYPMTRRAEAMASLLSRIKHAVSRRQSPFAMRAVR